VNPEVPLPLESIVLKAMHRNRRRRYAGARAMAEDLERFLNGAPLAAEPAGAGPRGFWGRLFTR
jgi:serine/threonine-protein kinase